MPRRNRSNASIAPNGMAMTPQQAALIHDSFAEIAPESDLVARIFYDRLFEIAPQMRPFFREDMTEQRVKFMATLSMLVNSLSNLDIVLPAAGKLAKRHVNYGVIPEHYPIVGQALLWTIQRTLGLNWTSDIAAAWTEAYGMLSDHMIGEAYGRQAPAE
jgi:nitric oxide dioxygenase